MEPGRVEFLGAGLRRVLAPNPSPMTGQGTNSYLLGQGGDLLLIDPGPNLPSHLAAIRSALQAGERIALIAVTHAHLDHSEAAPALAYETGAPVLAFGAAGEARSPVMQRLAADGLAGGGEGIDIGFLPDRRVKDGDRLRGDWGEVTVWHTPGHMAEHICLGWEQTLFSGDHVMGWSTSIVSPPDGDMTAYMTSLRQLQGKTWHRMMPGHGPEISDPAGRLKELLHHRLEREAAILSALDRGPATSQALAQEIYTDTPPFLLPAAERNILAHLIDLSERNLISSVKNITPTTIFHALPKRS